MSRGWREGGRCEINLVRLAVSDGGMSRVTLTSGVVRDRKLERHAFAGDVTASARGVKSVYSNGAFSCRETWTMEAFNDKNA